MLRYVLHDGYPLVTDRGRGIINGVKAKEDIRLYSFCGCEARGIVVCCDATLPRLPVNPNLQA